MTNQRILAIGKRIAEIKIELAAVGDMRPGSLTKQYRKAPSGVLAYWQLSYTHKMKSRTDYVRPQHLKIARAQVKAFRHFKALVDEWVSLAIELARLKTTLALEEEKSMDN